MKKEFIIRDINLAEYRSRIHIFRIATQRKSGSFLPSDGDIFPLIGARERKTVNGRLAISRLETLGKVFYLYSI